MGNAQDRQVYEAQPHLWPVPICGGHLAEFDEGRLFACRSVAQYRGCSAYARNFLADVHILQLPLGFGNAVVLQTMLSECLRPVVS